jgi:hypothetical protein
MNIFESKFEIKSHHHLNRYFKLLSNYLDHPKIKYVTESHHIYPKKYFPEYDSADYLVNLPKRVHFIAHHMLARAIGSTMWQSFQLMGRIKKHKSRHYAEFKEAASVYNNCPEKVAKISKSVKKLWEDPEYRAHQVKRKKEYVFSDEHRDNISKAIIDKKKPEGFKLGSKYTKEHKLNISKSKLGYKNPNTVPLTIYTANNIPILTILFGFREYCKELKLPTALYKTYKNNTRLYDYDMRKCDISKLTNEGKYQYKGWYARLAKDIKS